MSEDSFEYCADIAQMDYDWCREMLKSIMLLPEATRRDITQQCLQMLNFIEPILNIDKDKFDEVAHIVMCDTQIERIKPATAMMPLSEKIDRQIKRRKTRGTRKAYVGE